MIGLNAEPFSDIEDYIDQNLKVLIQNLQCCNAQTYKNQQQFRFLPAHRNLIKNLPSKIRMMKEKINNKSNRIRKTRHILIEEEDEDIAIVTHNQIVEQHQQELLNKMHEFGRSNSYSTVQQITMSDITEIVFSFADELTGQCQIVCPYCKHKYLTRFDCIWMTSNLNKHFREHETPSAAYNELEYEQPEIIDTGENNEVDDIAMENEEAEITDAGKNNEIDDFANAEFDSGGEQINESLSKTIQLQIESLESPKQTPQKKYPRLVLHRIQKSKSLAKKNQKVLLARNVPLVDEILRVKVTFVIALVDAKQNPAKIRMEHFMNVNFYFHLFS